MDEIGHSEEPLVFHPEENEYTRPVNAESVIVAIVLSLATLQGVGVMDVTSLGESVDTDSIESLASNLEDGSLVLDGRVSFDHDGYRISLDGDGLLHFSPVETETVP